MMPIMTSTKTKATASSRLAVRWLFYTVALGAFGYGTYKLYVVPDRATRIDFWLVTGSIIAAGIFTVIEQLRVRKQRRVGSNNSTGGK